MWRKALIGTLLLLFTSIVIAQPALAQNPVWHAEYYNNGDLSGTPVFTRDDANIAFNWGSGSPGTGINNDGFSVRWATDVSLSPGTYRFYAQADDNIRVIFNFGFQPVIDTFASGVVNQLVTGDVTVQQAGTYHIQVDYREVTDAAFAYMSFTNLSSNPVGPNFATPVAPIPVGLGAWTAQYYSNTGLSGDPVAILTEGSPAHEWGTGAPVANVPADNFSARWISSQSLAGGTYFVNAEADDGVRVWVNGVLVIDQWHAASGQAYSATLNLPAGLNYFQVEYYEASGNAYLRFSITQSGGSIVPTNVPSPTGASATVTAYRLNVRSTPDGINGQIITRINRLEVYPIVGRTADNRWYLINVNGTNGWVSASFINVVNGANVPVTNGTTVVPTSAPAQTASGNTVTANPYNVVIRSGPGTQYRRLGLLPNTATAPVVGRTANNSWWQINLNGLIGWVSSQYAPISSTANIDIIPITG